MRIIKQLDTMIDFDNAIVIKITAESTAGIVNQLQESLGGTIEERWGEHTLTINNRMAFGTIRFITFDWGVNLLEYDIKFTKDIILEMDASQYNPIHFTYCLSGYCGHRFGYQNKVTKLDQFQSTIITSRDGGFNYGYFPKNEKLEINVIQISRKQFLNKRLNGVSALNKKLYEVFLDSDHHKAFAYFGTYDLKLADKISALRKIDEKGMIRILHLEGLVYEILSMHIKQHDKDIKEEKLRTTLLTSELRTIRKLANKIIRNPSFPYSLESLSSESGLSQAKLQEGFKLLYTRTVTEYIRHVRLEAARDLINTTELTISEIVYSIGFSSRSYFSKIFKNKYTVSPSEYKNKVEEVPSLEEALA